MKNYKSFFAGMLTMLLIVCLTGTALATTGKVTKELEYRNISVSLDGKKLDLRDAKGNAVEPFMFEGTNYLPVRALAESLGLNVAWNSATNTVVLTTPGEANVTDETLLTVKDGVRFYYTGIEMNNNKQYIKIRCENDSDYRIFVYTRDLTINGKTISYDMNNPAFSFDCEVDPGRSVDTAIVISDNQLKANGIDEIRRFSVRFAGYDADKSGWNFETGGKSIEIN